MDVHTDTRLAQGDTSHNTSVESSAMDREHEPSDIASNEDSVPDNLSLPLPKVHLDLVTESDNIGAKNSIHPFKSNQELLDARTEENAMKHEHSCAHPQNNSGRDILLVVSEEVSQTECIIVSTDGPTSSIYVNDAVALATVYPEESSTVPLGTFPHNERGADRDDSLNPNQAELGCMQSAGLAGPTDKDQTLEDLDYPCDGLLLSLPPSSSPPQLFSSSPCASSQSSVNDVEPSKMVQIEGRMGSHGYAHSNSAILVDQHDSHSGPKNLHSHNKVAVTTSTRTDKYCPRADSTSCTEGDLAISRKRIANPDGSFDSQPIKRRKSGSCHYLPPAPKRVTLASQNRQFKKLAAPFRPPLKLPVVMDGLAQTTDNEKVESTINTTLETSHDKIDPRKSTYPFQHKASNKSKSVTQFKSPLVNGVLQADSRTIRLTPALQALERKLQLLKRAIKVKEENEVEVLVKLSQKWVEAGREVAYDVWDATKDVCDFRGKVAFMHESWESIGNGRVPWGWDAKPENADDEPRDLDQSGASCRGRPVSEEGDDNVSCNNTLGTMLRRLGIAPEIFGWDDDKEAFSD